MLLWTVLKIIKWESWGTVPLIYRIKYACITNEKNKKNRIAVKQLDCGVQSTEEKFNLSN